MPMNLMRPHRELFRHCDHHKSTSSRHQPAPISISTHPSAPIHQHPPSLRNPSPEHAVMGDGGRSFGCSTRVLTLFRLAPSTGAQLSNGCPSLAPTTYLHMTLNVQWVLNTRPKDLFGEAPSQWVSVPRSNNIPMYDSVCTMGAQHASKRFFLGT